MYIALSTIQKVDPARLARAAAGLADGSITVKVIHWDTEEIRAFVRNRDSGEYSVALAAQDTFCSCKDWAYRKNKINGVCKHLAATGLYVIRHPEEEKKDSCVVCGQTFVEDNLFHVEDGNNGEVMEKGPYCEACATAKLTEMKAALNGVSGTAQSLGAIN